MQMRRWLALALASSVVGCYVGPSTDLPDGPTGPTGSQADFRIDSVTGPATLSRATQGQVQARLCNGGDASATTSVTFSLSRDNVLDSGDAQLGRSLLTTVPAGGCRDVSAGVGSAVIADGTYVLMAMADADDFEPESNELNNSRVGALVRFERSPSPLQCPTGYADCDGSSANGCEVELAVDANHCGACGTSCPVAQGSTAVCVAGSCGAACPVGRFDCDGSAANGCESTTACGPAECSINRSAELVMTALPVVEDPVRTAAGGAWSFGTLMKAMAGDQDPSTLVRQWLRTWAAAQSVNGLSLPARTQMLTKVLDPWDARSGGTSRPLDFSRAPFRLLAITNRMDLRNPGVQAGEGRFVFGVLDPVGNPLEFTVILEYALPGGSPEAIQLWAHDWHELGQLAVGSAAYNAKLQGLTDRFAKVGVMTGRPFGNALNQIRTNEIALGTPWEMREFNLTETGLRPVTVKLTPEMGFDNSAVLGDFIRANEAAILSGQYTVPERFQNQAFLGTAAKVPERFFWRAPGVASEARHTFSLNTCSGCHAGETGTDFTHIAPRAAGRASELSVFLRGGTVRDPVTQQLRSFDDLGRRATDLAALVCGTPSQGLTSVETFGGFPAPSNLPAARVH